MHSDYLLFRERHFEFNLVIQAMKTYGSFEVVDNLADADERGSQHFLARKANSGQEPDKVIKLITYQDADQAAAEASEPFQKTRMQSQFISALKSQQIAAARGGAHIVNVHEFGSSNEGMWYCTDLYPRGSLRQLIGQTLDSDSLKHVVYSIVRGLLEMRKYSKRSHGDLTPDKVLLGGQKWDPIVETPIYLTEPSAVSSHDPRKAELDDLRNLGWIIYQLVTKQEIESSVEIQWPVNEIDQWKVFLGSHALFWVELCNRLLDPGLTLEEISLKRLRRLLRPKFSVKRVGREFYGHLRFRILWKFAVLAIVLGFLSLVISKPELRGEIRSHWNGFTKYLATTQHKIGESFASKEAASPPVSNPEMKLASQDQDDSSLPAKSGPTVDALHQRINAQQDEIGRLREKELELAQKLEAILESQKAPREPPPRTENTPSPAAADAVVPQPARQVDPASLKAPVGNLTEKTALPEGAETSTKELRGRFVRPLVNRPLETPVLRPSTPMLINAAFALPSREDVQSRHPKNSTDTVTRPGVAVPDLPLKNTLGMKFEWLPYLPPQSDSGPSMPGGFVGVAEVTQEQFERVLGINPSDWKGRDRPVHRVTWQQAMDFCQRITRIERQTGNISNQWVYTLPTLRQWRYFANIPANQEGREWDYILGNDGLQSEVTSYREDAIFPRAVDAFRKPNAFKLVDVFGNVREWSIDQQQGYPIALGWSYASKGDLIDRSAFTIPLPGEKGSDIGFRCLVVPAGP